MTSLGRHFMFCKAKHFTPKASHCERSAPRPTHSGVILEQGVFSRDSSLATPTPSGVILERCRYPSRSFASLEDDSEGYRRSEGSRRGSLKNDNEKTVPRRISGEIVFFIKIKRQRIGDLSSVKFSAFYIIIPILSDRRKWIIKNCLPLKLPFCK